MDYLLDNLDFIRNTFIVFQFLWGVILERYLAISGKQYGRPIHGQYEVVAISASKNVALWKTAEGIFVVN